ncbi:MAG: hypothetical protein KC502_08545 [Myxococcales bacterium]|nr:hypothetical protein [Myxococcales bacterium]
MQQRFRLAQQQFDRASRGLALRLDGRPAQIVAPATAAAYLAEADAASKAFDALVAEGHRGAALSAQVARGRIAGWQSGLERATASERDATEADRALATLLTRARLVLHRYARHFGGQHRATRDLSRLVEARIALVALTRRAQPLAIQASDPLLQQEARALPRFIEFLVQEQGEISDGLGSAGRLEQAQALGAICATLQDGWLAEVKAVHRLARRPGLLDRYIGAIDEVLGRMGAVRHANLPDAHEQAIATVSQWQTDWLAERAQTLAEQAAAGQQTCQNALIDHAAAIWQQLERELAEGTAEKLEDNQPNEQVLEDLRARCDRLDDALTWLGESGAVMGGEPASSDLRDGLIWLGQRYDQLASPS